MEVENEMQRKIAELTPKYPPDAGKAKDCRHGCRQDLKIFPDYL
jgi:hypothetical protein